MGGSPKETAPLMKRRPSLLRFGISFGTSSSKLEAATKVKSNATKDSKQQQRDNAPDMSLESYSDACIETSSSEASDSTTKKVCFGQVETREYDVVMGDHPCCTVGCPLSLGWDYSAEKCVSLDDYEASRAPRRRRGELLTSWDERRQILSDISDMEVRRAQRRSYRERSCRSKARASAGFFQEKTI